MATQADLAVVVVSHDDARWLDRCLATVADHAGDISIEIAVVENSASDASRGPSESHGARWLQTDNRGFAAANNVAAATTNARHLLFLNPDTEIVGGRLSDIVTRLHAEPSIGVLGAEQRTPDDRSCWAMRRFPSPARMLAEALRLRRHGELVREPAAYEQERRCDWVSGAFVAIRREAFERLGGFDERYFLYSEETDLCKRVAAAGWEVRYTPLVRFIHHVRDRTTPDLVAQATWSRLLYAQEHMPPLRRRAYLAALRLRHALRALPFGGRDARDLEAARRGLRMARGREGPPLPPGPDGWVVYGGTPWDVYWGGEHYMSHALAAQRNVLFVEPPVSPLTPLRSSVTSFRDLARTVRPRPADRLHVVRPLALPPVEHPRARRLSVPAVRRQVRAAARRVGLHRPVVLAMRFEPGMEGAAGEVLRVGFQQDWTPGGAELLGLRAEDLERSLEALWAASDLLITNSPPLRDKLAGRGVESTLLPYGFSLELADRYDDPCPPELAGLPRPLLGYTGSIDGRLDVGALEAVSERFADGTVLLVGPIHPRLAPDALDSLTVRSNVRIVGRQPREAIPAYLAQLDCALLPYGRSEWLEVQAPLKVWEYLYAGCPIVGSGNPSLRAFPPPLLRFVGPGEDFAAAVAQALAEGRSHANERRAFAAANSWEKRALELERLVEERMKKGASFRRPARS